MNCTPESYFRLLQRPKKLRPGQRWHHYRTGPNVPYYIVELVENNADPKNPIVIYENAIGSREHRSMYGDKGFLSNADIGDGPRFFFDSEPEGDAMTDKERQAWDRFSKAKLNYSHYAELIYAMVSSAHSAGVEPKKEMQALYNAAVAFHTEAQSEYYEALAGVVSNQSSYTANSPSLGVSKDRKE